MSTRLLTNDERFLAYYDKLRAELNTAYTHYEICKSLRELKSTRRTEYSEALTFFSLTMNSNLFATIMTINRFIDSRRDSLHLGVFFRFIKENLGLFSTEAYKRRLMENGMDREDCEHWATLHAYITLEMVGQDEERIETLPVDNLKVWRNKKLAHIERDFVTNSVDIMEAYPVTISEIDTIIATLHEILDRYRIAYDGAQWILGLPATTPDIEHIFDAILAHRRSRS
ncbi:hypothetical protein ACFLWM_02510 [Chloroflexota bacterium]